MKHIFTLTVVSLLSGWSFGQTVEDANVLLGNLSGSLYWDSYNDNTKTVSNLNFSVYADGSNSDYVTPPFTIKVYLWDGSNPTFVHTYNDPGIHHFGGRDYQNQTIDLSDLSLPAGSYRLGVFVDADDAIPGSTDDPADNAYLAEGEINYTPGGSSASLEETDEMNTLMVFPNPATDQVFITWEAQNTTSVNEIRITDLNGNILQVIRPTAGTTSVNAVTSDFKQGIYVVTLVTDDTISTTKFIKY